MHEPDTQITPADDGWPVPEETTLVGGAPPPPVAPPPVTGPPPPDRRIGAGMLLGLGAVLLAAIGIALAWYFTHRSSSNQTTTVVVTNPPARTRGPAVKKVAVPRLIGMTKDKALVRVAQLGFQPKVVYQPTKKPKDTVVSQKPQEATELAKGKTVTLVVDSTPKPKPKPKPKTTPTPTTTAAQQTTTTATTTAATTTAPRSQPLQPANATVPDVSNQQEAAAVQAMNQAGILASLTWVPGSGELGTVIAQAKPSGTTVPYHSHVQLNLSTGPGQKASEQVPNVVGQPLKGALAAINGAHLRMIYVKLPVSDRSQAGKVVQQSPLGGTAPENAQIVVWLGAYGS
jgi:beta-lactam-binding protein with PASTA domain